MKNIICLSILAIVLLLTSCGEIMDIKIIVDAKQMHLDRNTLLIMKGDSCRLNMVFTPDSVTNESAFWSVAEPHCVSVTSNGMVLAKSVGETDIKVISVQSRLEDTCHVTVFDTWTDLPCSMYPYDMVVYANVTINGKPMTNDQVITANCGDELRGYGHLRTYNGVTCCVIRIWSPNPSGETIAFCSYDHNTVTLVPSSFTLPFDGESHGTPSRPLNIDF